MNRDYLVVHYKRANGDYDGWGLHLWGDGLADGVGTTWAAPRKPDGADAYGAYWKVPLKDPAAPLNFIVHQGDTKDQAADQSLDLATYGNEVWFQSGVAGYLLPEVGASAPDADLIKAAAQLIDGTALAWKVNASASKHYALVYSPSGDLAVKDDDLTGDVHLIRLTWLPTGLTAAQLAKYPNLAGYAAFTVDPRDVSRVRTALRAQLIATERGPDGSLVTATGVQLPGALDDL